MRKLVTIRKISAINAIEGADRIVQCTIDGWNVIVKKDEFTVGDSCLFFEIDSFLPASDERYAFLGKPKTYNGKEGYRIRTMKMRGVISQGLALPLSMFDIDTSVDDLASQLGVIKYDVAAVTQTTFKTGRPQGKFPSFIPKTDQPRLQNLTGHFSQYKDHCFEETLKLDGSSMTCYKIDRELSLFERIKQFLGWSVDTTHFGVCSRNLEIKPSHYCYTTTFNNDGKQSTYAQSDFWKAAIKYDIQSKIPSGYAIQGELIGPKIQSNHEKVDDLEYYIFDVFDIDAQQYLLPQDRIAFCRMYKLPHVPVKNASYPVFKHFTDIPSLLKHVEGESMNPDTISEGRVFKSVSNPSLTFKAISNNYLLKCED